MPSTRLDPEVFKVPIDKIRAGYYSDKYFLRVSSPFALKGCSHIKARVAPWAYCESHRWCSFQSY
jgi:hypothetical protein